MKATEVKPKDWLWDSNYPIRVLFDDEAYSVIWGKYKDNPALGTRWNGGSNTEVGFPNHGEHPTWFVEPDFIASAILQRLLSNAIDTSDFGYYDNILFAISELNKQIGRFDYQEE